MSFGRVRRTKVFISYSHKDSAYLEEFQIHLKPLERSGIVSRWDDTLIQAGSQWRQEIERALQEAKVAVLFISQYFLASDFIAENELPPLLAAAKDEGAVILPVIIRPCRFKRTESLLRFQAINSPDKTLAEMDEASRDRVWVNLTEAIEDTLVDSGVVLSPERTVPIATEHLGTVSKPSLVISHTEAQHGQIALMSEHELHFLVHEDHKNGQPNFTFQLKTLDPTLGINDRIFGPVALSAEPSIYFRNLSRDIEEIELHDRKQKEAAQRRLEAQGAYLFKELLPDDLKELLWYLRGRVETVKVQSDEVWIPWEMLQLQGRENGRWVTGPFLCEAFAMTRWLRGVPEELHLPVRNIALVMPQDTHLPGVEEECRYILSLADRNRAVSRIPAHYLEVYDALASGQFDGWHFSGHSVAQDENPDRWRIILENNESLCPQDLSGSASNLGLGRPLVFLSGGYINGWARRLIDAGAGAVVGSYWVNTDMAAMHFAESFYKHFLSGMPISRAVREARLEVKEKNPGDPAWLTFTVFANPLASCDRE